MDERAAKRKREGEEKIQDSTLESQRDQRKKPRLEGQSTLEGGAPQLKVKTKDDQTIAAEKAAKRRAKRERHKAKKELKAAEAKARKEQKRTEAAISKAEAPPAKEDIVDDPFYDEMEDIEIDDLEHAEQSARSTVSPSPSARSPFDPSQHASGSSSISSIAPSAPMNEPRSLEPSKPEEAPEAVEANDPAKLPEIDPQVLRERFHQRLEELRAARKADGADGKAARTRQDLIEARRGKEEQKKAHKKELREKAKEQERRKQAEIIAQGSPLLSPAIHSPGAPTNDFAFGRIAFLNGQQASADLSSLRNTPKSKGPQDPQTALKAAQKKEKRLAGFDEAKRGDIAEKDIWLNSMKRAQGERVRDDSSLLKKTLKRKEKQKKQSEEKWNERLDNVKKGQEIRQKKREINLAKRREEKGKDGKKVKSGKSKPKARPGFEGSFRARSR